MNWKFRVYKNLQRHALFGDKFCKNFFCQLHETVIIILKEQLVRMNISSNVIL